MLGSVAAHAPGAPGDALDCICVPTPSQPAVSLAPGEQVSVNLGPSGAGRDGSRHSQSGVESASEVGTGLWEPLRASQNKWGLGEASRRHGVHQGHGQAPLGVTIPKYLAAGVLLCLFVLLNLSDRSSGQGKARDPDSHPLGLSAGLAHLATGSPTWGQECECLSFGQSDPGSLSCG